MEKKIDLSKTVSELIAEYPEIKDMMVGLGFKDIVKPMALATVGKIMTIPKGAAIKGIELKDIIAEFRAHGFEIKSKDIGAELSELQPETDAHADTPEERSELLKSYVRRLSDGEPLESVRNEFVENFNTVDAAEIARAGAMS